jgi:hypothetical protein
MTITRLFFYATLATCPLWGGAAWAHPTLDGLPATASSAATPVTAEPKASSLHAQPSSAHGKSKTPPATKAVKGAVNRQASTAGAYSLSHQPHQLDSYQKAVTPPVTTDR